MNQIWTLIFSSQVFSIADLLTSSHSQMSASYLLGLYYRARNRPQLLQIFTWKIRENMSWAWPMAKSRTRTKIVMEIGSASASTTPARLIIINELIMRWTLATAYPAEMLGAPRQNLRGIVETGWNKPDSLNYFTKWWSQVISNQ